MLSVVYLTTLILITHPLKYCIYFRYSKNCNHPFFEVNVSFLLVVPLFVTRCHSLSFAVIRCHSLYHSSSFVVILCHWLSLDVPLVCLFINDVPTTDPVFVHLTYLFFFYLLAGTVKEHVKHQRRKFLQQ